MMSLLVLLLSARAFALDVVCTLPYLWDVTRRVAPNATVVVLARGTDDPHFLSPTPALMAQVAKADVYVENGLNLELWSERLLDSAGNPKIRPGQPGYVRATVGVKVLDVPTDLSRAKGDLHPEGNPHIWTDPLNMLPVADNIAAGLGRVDPGNAATYTANAKAFKTKIEEATFGPELVKFMGGDLLVRLAQAGNLDTFLASKNLTDKLGGWLKQAAPLKAKPIVFYHQSWPYFVARFGVNVVGYVEDRPGIPPTASHRDALLALMKANNVKVVEVTTYYDDKIPTLLAQSVGGKVAHVAGDVGGMPAASDYFAYITSLVTAFL
jgi:zinc/manganese transport system substrate-binding protein